MLGQGVAVDYPQGGQCVFNEVVSNKLQILASILLIFILVVLSRCSRAGLFQSTFDLGLLLRGFVYTAEKINKQKIIKKGDKHSKLNFFGNIFIWTFYSSKIVKPVFLPDIFFLD